MNHLLEKLSRFECPLCGCTLYAVPNYAKSLNRVDTTTTKDERTFDVSEKSKAVKAPAEKKEKTIPEEKQQPGMPFTESDKKNIVAPIAEISMMAEEFDATIAGLNDLKEFITPMQLIHMKGLQADLADNRAHLENFINASVYPLNGYDHLKTCPAP